MEEYIALEGETTKIYPQHVMGKRDCLTETETDRIPFRCNRRRP